MYAIIGGTGHVGSAAARSLLNRGEAVTIITRNPDNASDWKDRGARLAEADVRVPEMLRAAIRGNSRLLIVNPPADPTTDFDREEHETIGSILEALDGAGLERIVAQSTYGVRKGAGIGDLGTLHGLEEGLRNQPVPSAIVRAAYHMSNWAMALETARSQGFIPTMFPEDLRLPMVAPQDVGKVMADLATADGIDPGPHFAEGPARYTPRDAADCFARALGKPVDVRVTPRNEIEQTYRSLGFSEESAASFTGMTKLTLDELELPENPIRGVTSLDDYIAELVKGSRPQ